MFYNISVLNTTLSIILQKSEAISKEYLEKSSDESSDSDVPPQKRRRRTKRVRRVRVFSSSSSSGDCTIIDNGVKSPPIVVISSDEGEIENDLKVDVTPHSVIECVEIPSSYYDVPQTPHKPSISTLPFSECVTISSSSEAEYEISKNPQKLDCETTA